LAQSLPRTADVLTKTECPESASAFASAVRRNDAAAGSGANMRVAIVKRMGLEPNRLARAGRLERPLHDLQRS
jgi:hypothetical protein